MELRGILSCRYIENLCDSTAKGRHSNMVARLRFVSRDIAYIRRWRHMISISRADDDVLTGPGCVTQPHTLYPVSPHPNAMDKTKSRLAAFFDDEDDMVLPVRCTRKLH